MRGIGTQEAGLPWGVEGWGGFYVGNTILQIYSAFNYMWILLITFSMLFKVPGHDFQFYEFTQGKIITTWHYFFSQRNRYFVYLSFKNIWLIKLNTQLLGTFS